MNRNEFMGHCFCSWRFEKLKWMIETQSLTEVQNLYELHKTLRKNSKYDELEVEFQKRLNNQ